MLEKQLDYMRKLVQAAERDRIDAEQKAEVLQQQKKSKSDPSPFSPDYHGQLQRIGELERDHLRLTATQTLAEVGIVYSRLKHDMVLPASIVISEVGISRLKV
jgi:centrosomal protein CEP57